MKSRTITVAATNLAGGLFGLLASDGEGIYLWAANGALIAWMLGYSYWQWFDKIQRERQ